MPIVLKRTAAAACADRLIRAMATEMEFYHLQSCSGNMVMNLKFIQIQLYNGKVDTLDATQCVSTARHATPCHAILQNT